MTVVDLGARWLPMRARADADALPLFCLPHAGGSASAYGPWIGRVPGVAVLPVQPPGRESRYREPAYERMEPLVDELASVVLEHVGEHRPYAVYGHSHGALVAFEVLREVRRRGGHLPVRLFVSGAPAPQCGLDDGPPVTAMSRADLVTMMRRLGGTPEWLLSDPSALDMVLPAIRGDFSVREAYGYVDEAPLDVPLTVLASTADPRVSVDRQARWAEQTTAGCTVETLPGGHFAVFEQAARTHAAVAAGLAPWLVGPWS